MYSMVNTLFDFFFCKHRTAYEMRISDWSSDVCSSDLNALVIGCPVRTAGEQIFSDGLGIEFRYGRQHGPGRGGVTRRIDGFVRNTSQRRRRPEVRRVGTECVSTGGSGGPQYLNKLQCHLLSYLAQRINT